MPHKNHVDSFFLTHTQFEEIINLDFIFAPIISHWKDDITEFHIRNASNNISHSVDRKRSLMPSKRGVG